MTVKTRYDSKGKKLFLYNNVKKCSSSVYLFPDSVEQPGQPGKHTREEVVTTVCPILIIKEHCYRDRRVTRRMPTD